MSDYVVSGYLLSTKTYKHEDSKKNLVPTLQLGNSVREAPASRLAKLELRYLGSQAGAWEPAYFLTWQGRLRGNAVKARYAASRG